MSLNKKNVDIESNNKDLIQLENNLKVEVKNIIFDFCQKKNISFHKYQVEYLNLTSSNYNHKLDINKSYQLTNFTVIKLLSPILKPNKIKKLLLKYHEQKLEIVLNLPEITSLKETK